MSQQSDEATTEPVGGGGEQPDEGTEQEQHEPDYRALARKHEKEAKRARTELTRLQQQLDEHSQTQQTDQDRAINAARNEGKTEGEEMWRGRYVQAAAQAQALALLQGKVNAPMSVVLRALDLSAVEMDEQGRIDKESVRDAVDALLEEWGEEALGQDSSRTVRTDPDYGPRRRIVKTGAPNAGDLWRTALRGPGS